MIMRVQIGERTVTSWLFGSSVDSKTKHTQAHTIVASLPTYIHTYIHTYVHIYTHTCIHADMQFYQECKPERAEDREVDPCGVGQGLDDGRS